MAFKLSKRSEKALGGVEPALANVIRAALKTSLVDFGVSSGARTVKEQQKLFAQGRTEPGNIVTWVDGIVKLSNHQVNERGLGQAVDLFVYRKGRDAYDPLLLGYVAGHIVVTGRQMGVPLEWGGLWDKTQDGPHIQLAKGWDA